MARLERILILGACGTTNWGDELAMGSVARLLQTAYPHAEIRAFSYRPEISTKFHPFPFVPIEPYRTLRFVLSRAKSFEFRTAWEGLRARRETDRAFDWAQLLVLGGGNLLTDFPFYFLEHYTDQIASRARRKGVELAVVGTGYGPINTRRGREILEKLARLATVHLVREPGVSELLRAAGAESVAVIGDPVLLFPPRPEERERQTQEGQDEWDLGDTPQVVSLRYPADKADAIFLELLRPSIEVLRSEGSVQGLPFDCEQDPPALRGLLRATEVCRPSTPRELAARVRSSVFVLGMRFHSLILAAAYGIPFVGLPCHRKVVEFVDLLGAGLTLPLPVDESTSRWLAGRLREVLANRGELGTQVKKAVERLRAEGLRMATAVLGKLPFDTPAGLADVPMYPPPVAHETEGESYR